MPTINTINDFAAVVHTALTAAFPECCVEMTNVTKNNGVCQTGITVQPKNQNVVPAIYLEPYFSALQSGQTLESVISQIASTCAAGLSCSETGIDEDEIKDFDRVKDRICYKLVSRDMNSGLLSDVPHRYYHSLAVIYYLQHTTDKGLLTVTVTNGLAQIWGTDEKSLFALAAGNTPRLCRGIVLTMEDVLDGSENLKTSPYKHFDFTCSASDIQPMYVATNKNKTYGAAVILYDGLLETAAEKIGSFYAIPSSVHEFMLIPDSFGELDSIKRMVKEINAAEVPDEEILSDTIFHYDAGTHELKIAV